MQRDLFGVERKKTLAILHALEERVQGSFLKIQGAGPFKDHAYRSFTDGRRCPGSAL